MKSVPSALPAALVLLRKLARQAAVIAVVVVGAAGTVATSYVGPDEFTVSVTSPERVVAVTLTDAAPQARFRVAIESSTPVSTRLNVVVSVSDDNDDVESVADVGVLAPGGELPIEDPLDGTFISAFEGSALGVGSFVEDEGTVAVRKAAGAPEITVELRLSAAVEAAPDAADTTRIEITAVEPE